MPKVLVIHGAGMNMRGKVQLDVFGPMTLPEYDQHIRKYAAELGLEVEIFHSNVEGEVIDKFYDAHERGVDGALGAVSVTVAVQVLACPTETVPGAQLTPTEVRFANTYAAPGPGLLYGLPAVNVTVAKGAPA